MANPIPRAWRRLTDALTRRPPNPILGSFSSEAAFREWRAGREPELARQIAEEIRYPPSTPEITHRGRCWVCGDGTAEFRSTWEYAVEHEGRPVPNWREHLKCTGCHLNNRMRAALHLLQSLADPPRDAPIYITEQFGPLFQRLSLHFPSAVGSEFLRDGTPPGGVNFQGVRHEDMTRLSFADDRFAIVMSFDVLEHVPSYRAALGECYRVLRPGGTLFLTAPFSLDASRTTVRAEVADDGSIVHHLPPEYHGDPLSDAGCLAFYHFGWDLLDDLEKLGFETGKVHVYWSRGWGYLGRHLSLITARKPSR